MPRHQLLSQSLWAPCLRGEISVDAHAAQRRAAAPGASAWVSASAGTGKTKVLTDRLLGLMLEGSDPARILCLTFTRAAAAEMANRLNERLADWATLPHDAFVEELRALAGREPDEARLAQARQLFARVLDLPGGRGKLRRAVEGGYAALRNRLCAALSLSVETTLEDLAAAFCAAGAGDE